MKFKIKLLKILFSTIAISALGASSVAIVSCSQNGDSGGNKIWSNFQQKAKNEKAIAIVKASNMTLWANFNDKQLKMKKMTPLINKSGFCATIVSISPYSQATFTILYKSVAYDITNWHYNNDYQTSFSHNPDIVSLPKSNYNDNQINQVLKIDKITYVITESSLYISTNDRDFTFDDFAPAQSSDRDYYNIIKIVKFGNITYLACNRGLFTSTDGLTFHKNSGINDHARIKDIVKIDEIIYVTTFDDDYHGSCFYYSTDGVKFVKNNVFSMGLVSQIIKVDKIIYVVLSYDSLGGKEWLFTSTDGINFIKNISWSKIDWQKSDAIKKIVKLGDYTYITTHSSGIFSAIDGLTFIQNTSIKTNLTTTIDDIIKINNIIYVTTSNLYPTILNKHGGLWTSTDGLKFSKSPIIKKEEGRIQITKIDNIIYLTTFYYDKNIYNTYSSLWTSTDGLKFSKTSIILSRITIRPIKINKHIFIGTNSGLYMSTDLINFSIAYNGLANNPITTIKNFNGIVYIGTNFNGLFTNHYYPTN